MSIKYPITVEKITVKQEPVLNEKLLFGGKCGDMVSVRPCDEKYGGKTFLGILIGDISLSPYVQWNEKDKELTVSVSYHNPLIFIPEHNSVVYGCGSWWGQIESEKQLKEITD